MIRYTNFLIFAFFFSSLPSIGQLIPKELTYSLAFPNCVISVDINQDTYLDIVCSSRDDNRIVWFENLQNNSFGSQQSITEYAMLIEMIASADFDNDGDMDIVSINKGDNSIIIYYNLGGGIFDSGTNVTNSFIDGEIIQTADLDDDGWIDVVAASRESNRICWFPNIGGTIANEILISDQILQPLSIDVGDVNNDGSLDIICGFDSGNDLFYFSNNGQGAFSTAILLNSESVGIVDVKLFDVDHDLDLDITYSLGSSNSISIMYNLGNGVFGSELVLSSPDNAVMIDFVDIDNDLWEDLVISAYDDSQIEWQKNTNGLFGPSNVLFDSPSNYNSLAFLASDLNNDSYPDIVSASTILRAIIYHENEIGLFDNDPDFMLSPQINTPRDIDVADINGDGLDDIVFLSPYYPSLIGYFPNEGNSQFDTIEHLFLSTEMWSNDEYRNLRLVDVDSDSDIDLLLRNDSFFSFEDSIFWIENDGFGTFSNPSSIPLGVSSGYTNILFETGDMDDDGDIDIVSGSFDGDQIRWHENIGGGNFNSGQIITALVDGPFVLKIVDIDGDLDQDVCSISSNDGKIAWYENLGNGLFGIQQVISIEPSTFYVAKLFAEDLDNNGTKDVLVSISNNDMIYWFSNLGSGVFSAEQYISNEIDNHTIIPTDLDGDGDIDIVAREDVNMFVVPRILWLENLGSGVFNSYGPVLQFGDNDVTGGSFKLADLDNDGDEEIINEGAGSNSSIWILENNWSYLTHAKGKVYVDLNQNNIQDSADIVANLTEVTSIPESFSSFTSNNGDYQLEFRDTGFVYNLFPNLSPNWGITTDSVFYSIFVDSMYSIRDSLDFGIFPTFISDSLGIELTGGFPRCNTLVNYWINIANKGTSVINSVIELELDANIDYSSAIPMPDSVIGQKIYWHCDSLVFFDDSLIKAVVAMPDFSSIGDTLMSILSTYTLDSQGAPNFSAFDTLGQVLVCAYDPNDKISEPQGIGENGYIEMGTPSIDYTVRFQNTGNDTAIVVIVKDQLDSNLNWQSINPLAFSHPVEIQMNEDGLVTFKFANIMLPDSNVNELASQGFLKYRIELNPGLTAGTLIKNSAEIYFDFNPPIVTNTKKLTLYDCQGQFQNITALSSPVCSGDTLEFNPSIPSTISWNIAGVDQNQASNFFWVADTTGQFVVNLELSTSCPADTTILLNVNPSYFATVLPEVNICSGDSLLIFGTFRSNSGIYIDSIFSSSGCDSIITQNLVVFNLPDVNLDTFVDDTICVDVSAFTLPIGTPINGNYFGNGVADFQFDPQLAEIGLNIIYYQFTDSNGCENLDSSSIVINECLSLEEFNESAIHVYPNPGKSLINIEFKNLVMTNYFMNITDIFGKQVLNTFLLNDNFYVWDATNFTSGMYFINLLSIKAENIVFVTKVILE